MLEDGGLELLFVERVDLLEPDDGDVLKAVFFAKLGEVVVDPAGAKNDAASRGGDGGIRQNFLERAAGASLCCLYNL